MLCSSKSTEERIKEAAKVVFMEKGFDGTTTRDIAKAAGINSALMNYYFRSKEKLFQSIFEDMAQLFFKGIVDTFNQPTTLREKVGALIDHEYKVMMDNPRLSIFILNEIHRNPERLHALVGPFKRMGESIFQKQLDEEVVKGKVRPVSALHILMIIVSNIQFLYISKPMVMLTWEMSEKTFQDFAENHIRQSKEMICSYLFDYEPSM